VPGRKRLPPIIGAGGSRSSATPAEDDPRSAVEPARQLTLALLRRRHLIERIVEVAGARGFLELIEELLRHGLVDESELDRVLTRYAALDPRIVRALGADNLPPRPVRVVGGRE
jgi:hypothetical protein